MLSPVEKIWDLTAGKEFDSFWLERSIEAMKMRLEQAKEREAIENAKLQKQVNRTILEDLEERATCLFADCARLTGLEGYQRVNDKLAIVLGEIEQIRPLTRWEFINRHGYMQWRAFVDANGLQEDSPHAIKRELVAA